MDFYLSIYLFIIYFFAFWRADPEYAVIWSEIPRFVILFESNLTQFVAKSDTPGLSSNKTQC